ncbi:hypothetical protein LTR64_004553 [Lithohypha guttulata]|uniref:uncharacterized protein n=1 Tax=Lithohypha guttulata TaxID=1690604 RepID=UPI00315CA565
MLPSSLQSSYRLYKQDTDDIATWLAETARLTGYTSEALPAPTQTVQVKTKSKGKSKSKTKKQLRDAARRVPKEQREHVIPIREFAMLAEHIAQHVEKALKVPLSILHKLQRTIDSRRECSLWFRTYEQDEKSDESHAYFLSILEGVYTLLEPHSSLPSEKMESNVQEIGNLFSHLHVEEPSHEFQESRPSDSSATVQQTQVMYQAEHPATKSEMLFAAFSMFNDIGRIHTFLTNIWDQYHQGSLDLITVSVTSNTAIDFVRRLEKDFFGQFTSIDGPEEVINTLIQLKCHVSGNDMIHMKPPNGDVQEVIHFIYGDMFLLLTSFMDVFSLNAPPVYRPGHFGKYDPTVDRKKLTSEARFEEDKIILAELLCDFWFLARSKDGPAWEDGLTQGFRVMLNSRKVHIWTMFAAKLFLDVHHLLRLAEGVPFKQIQGLGKHLKESWLLTLRMRDSSQDTLWPDGNDRAVQGNLLDAIEQWLEGDIIQKGIEQLVQGKVSAPQGKFRLLQQHALLCGLLAFYLQATAQRTGVLYANALGVVLYTGHLYNAVCQERDCETAWADMDLMINIQTEERVFVGGKPNNAQDYFKRFCLCMGYSAETFAANRRQHVPLAASRGPRSLEIKGDMSHILYENSCEGSGSCLDKIEELINNKFVVDKDDGNEDPPEPDTEKVAIRKRTKGETKAFLRHKLRKQAALSPVELLLAMQAMMSQEVPMLAFDYFHLHRACWMMLDTIQQVLHQRFSKYFEAGYLETKSQLPFIVGYIFMVASGSQKTAERLGLKKPRAGMEVSSELLTVAGQLIQTLLNDQNFGPYSRQATAYIARDGRLFFSPSEKDRGSLEDGITIDFGDFELIYAGDTQTATN